MRVSPAPPPPPSAGPQQTPPISHTPHSPHMSPAVGGPGNVVMSPNPSSGQNENRNSSMHAPGYPPGAPHMPTGPPGPHGYPSKLGHMTPGPPGPPGAPYGQSGYQQGPGGHQYPPSRPQGHIMQPYPQNYPPPPPGGPQGPQGHQYSPRATHNSHVPPNQAYGYPHFGQQNWGQPMMGTGGIPGKGGPSQMPVQPAPGPQGTNNVGVPRAHYLKQHLQHKIGGYPPQPSTGGSQMYPNGPGMPPGMVNSRESPQNNMPPPTSTPQPLTPSGAPAMEGGPPELSSIPPNSVASSLGVMNNAAPGSTNSVSSVNSVNSNPPQIGPDGTPLVDEASQQSTVSNTSAASGDDRSCTPKPHKDGLMGALGLPRGPGDVMMGGPGAQHPPGHTPAPLNSAPSPGTASMSSQIDEFDNVNSPGGWPRSPSGTPVSISGPRGEFKGAPLGRVYANSQPPPPPEIYRTTKPGDSIMRLYEISDSPERRAWLDKLLRFMEENKTPITACPTISKNPLDLYALYLHVRERGGFEEVTNNKHWKDVAAVMGIGASSSGSYTLRRHYMKHILAFECKFDRGGIDPQPIINKIESSQKKKTTKALSVPSPGSSNSSMDGFSNGPHMPGGPGMLGGSGMPGPYSQYPPSSEFPGHMQQRPSNQSTPGYQGFQGNQYPGYQGMHGGFSQGGFPNAGFPPDRSYQPPPSNHQGNYPAYPPQSSYQRPGFPPPPPPSQQGTYQQESYPGFQYPTKPGTSPSPGPQPPNSTAAFQGPRRHPDFEKGWRPPSTQYSSYGGQGPPQVTAQQPWTRPNDSGPPQGTQWNQPRYPTPPSQTFPNQARWTSSGFSSSSGVHRTTVPPAVTKNYMVTPTTSFKSGGYGTYMGKQLFPVDSVEAVSPVLVKRKRMSRTDISPIDPWRLLMSLRCGLASEVTWALDALNILLFDDQTVVYFGLNHMPGLLETLIEHLRRGLINMFNICSELELGRDDEATGANKRIKAEQHDYKDRPWFARPPPSPSLDLDLGRLEEEPDPGDKETLIKGVDYTLTSRTGKPVRILKKEGKLFMREGSREWDKWEGFDSGVDTWSVGGGECTAHIICSMQSAVPPSPFTRLISGKEEEAAAAAAAAAAAVTASATTTTSSNCSSASSPAMTPVSPAGGTFSSATTTTTNPAAVAASVPPQTHSLPLPSQSKEDPLRKSTSRSEYRNACVTSQCVIKIEKMDVGDRDKVTTSGGDRSKVETKLKSVTPPVIKQEPPPPPPPSTEGSTKPSQESKERDVLSIFSDKCNGPKETSTKSLVNPKCNRKINAKTSKLDAIVKRIKKEPLDSSSLSIFNKAEKAITKTDSKSLLDHYLKSEESADSEKPVLVSKPSSVGNSLPVVPTPPETTATAAAGVSEGTNGKDTAVTVTTTTTTPSSTSSSTRAKSPSLTVDAKAPPVKSPIKLPSIPVSPIKISGGAPDKPLQQREGGGTRRESAGFKRPYEDLEEESWSPDEASLSTTTEGQDWLARRVIAVGTVIRNLSFIPGNEDVMSKSASLLALLGKTILLHHNHPVRFPATTHYDRDEETDFSDWCSSLASDTYWWWPYLHHVHENTLVTLANMAGHLDLSYYPEEISRPILNGLLHWATCPASYGQDTLPGGGCSPQSALSPQRLALEALVKLCVLDPNTDLVLATPPFSRLDMLCAQLTRLLCRGEDQVAREFAINLFHYFSAADSGVARVIAMQNGCVSLLVAFIEEAESAALNVANIQGVNALKDNPELMGTSLDMVRRSATTLVNLSRVPDNSRVITACENRFLTLVMSQILDTYVASQLSQVLFNVAQVQSEIVLPPSPPLSPSALSPAPEGDDNDKEGSQAEDEKNASMSPYLDGGKDGPPHLTALQNDKRKSNGEDEKETSSPMENCEEGSKPCSAKKEESSHPFTQAPSSPLIPPSSNSTPSSCSTSTISASSSSSSPMSVTSHPSLSPAPSSSLSHAATCAESSINPPKTAVAQAAPQVAPTL